MNNYTVSIPRAKPCVSAETVEKLESLDGLRRAHGRVLKCSAGNGRWEPVVGFTLRQKIDGKFKIVGSKFTREYAVKFINGEV
jgi:hypothetical protein